MALYTPFGSVFTFSECTLSLPDGMLIGLILALILCLSAYRRHSLFQKFCYLLLYVYFGALVSLTIPILLPGGWDLSSQGASFAVDNIQFVPFVSSWEILKNCVLIDNYREFWRLIGGNFLLLTPLGILIPAIHRRFGTPQMFLTALFSSLGIEALQFLGNIFSGNIIRTVEIDDIILNVLGCMAAYALYRMVHRAFVGKGKR